MVKAWASFVIKYRWVIIFITPLLVTLLGYGATHLTFKTDYRVFFSQSNPQMEDFEWMQDIYSKEDNILFVLSPKNKQVFTTSTLSEIEEMTEAAWQLPQSTRVDSLSNYQHTEAVDDDLDVAPLYQDANQLSDDEIARIKNIAVNEPLLVHRLISPNGRVSAINVTFQLEGTSPTEVPAIVAKAEEIRIKYQQKYPDVKIAMTGMLMMNNAFGSSSIHDFKTLVPIMFVLVIFTMFFMLRSIGPVVGSVVVILLSIAGGMGIAGWMGWYLTGPSAISPTIIMTMAVADTIHLMIGYIHYLRHGMDKHSAMKETLRVNFQPVFLTSATTVVGFLSMNFSEVPPFHDLGNIVSFGVVFAWLFSVTFLPALVVTLPIKVKLHEPENTVFMDHFSDWVIQHKNGLFWSTLVVIGLSASMVPKNELNDQYVKYFSKNVLFRADTDFVNDNLTGIANISYSLKAVEGGGIANPKFLSELDEFTQWLRNHSKVSHVNSILDVIKRLNKNMHGDDPAYYKIPENNQLTAQYLLLYENSLPYGLDLNNQLTSDKASTKLTITFANMSTNEVIGMEKEISTWLHENAKGLTFKAASPSLMFAHIGQRNIRSMLMGTFIALILISIILTLALKSIKLGFISMITNLFPALVAFGLWGAFVGNVGMSLAVVASMTLGIVVDDTVHFLSKYLRAIREKGYTSAQAIRYSFSHVGVALWVTTLILVVGFLVLYQSDFAINSDMGILTAITIAVALAIDFLFLPPLLIKFAGTEK